MNTEPKIVGEANMNVRDLSKPERLIFRFHNFKQLAHDVGSAHRSTCLTCHGYKWKILIFPGGVNYNYSGIVSIYLEFASESTIEVRTFFSLRVKKNAISSSSAFKYADSFGWHDFIDRSELDSYLEDGSLVIEVDIQVYDSPLSYASRFAQESNTMGEDMLKIFESGEFADIVFLVGGETFRAHRAIVASRSPGLLGEVAELLTESNEVEINGLDPQAFQTFLRYLYSDEVPSTLNECAEKLLKVADRFGSLRLKLLAECELVKAGIMVDNAVDLILLADAHNCALLKEAGVEFFVTHAKDVMASDGWSKIRESTIIMEKLMKYGFGCSSSDGTTKSPNNDAAHDDIDKMRVVPLRRKLSELGLPVDGSREMLVKRLKAFSTSTED